MKTYKAKKIAKIYAASMIAYNMEMDADSLTEQEREQVNEQLTIIYSSLLPKGHGIYTSLDDIIEDIGK